MSIVERFFLVDAFIKGKNIYANVLNQAAVKIVKDLGVLNFTYVCVFDEHKFHKLLRQFNGLVVTKKICAFDSTTSNLYNLMTADKAFSTSGYLFELQTFAPFNKLKTFLNNNSLIHREIFNHSEFFRNPIDLLSMKFSIKQYQEQCNNFEISFKFIPLINSYIFIQNSEIIAYEETLEFPFAKLPLVSFDIEVVAKNLETFPIGLKKDEFINSIACVVKYNEHEFKYAIIVAGTSLKYPIDVDLIEPSIEAIYQVVNTELELLLLFASDFMSGKFLKLFNLPRFYSYIISGYNIDNFDYPYLMTRYIHHRLYPIANQISLECGIQNTAISFDLFFAEKKFLMPSDFPSLNSVAEQFLNEKKLPIHVTHIRQMYNFDQEQEEKIKIDSNRTVGGFFALENGKASTIPTFEYFLDYNIQDCALIHKLYDKQSIFNIIHEMCKLTNMPYHRALRCGNSIKLTKMMFIYALNENRYLVSNIPYTKMAYVDNESQIFNQLLKLDSESINLEQVCSIIKEFPLSYYDDDYDEYCEQTVLSKKAFSGGANDAIRCTAPNIFSMDCLSFYPSIIKQFSLDLNNVIILPKMLIPVNLRNLFCENHYVFVYLTPPESLLSSLHEWQWPQLTSNMDDYDDSQLMLIILKTKSMLKELVIYLMEKRQECKNQLKRGYDPVVKARELVLKVMSCCVFGVLGYARFPYKQIFTAAAITFLARNLIILMVSKLAVMNIQTVYVDTDGIMCQSNSCTTQAHVEQLADEITKQVGMQHIILEPELLYKYGIILSKKKYILQRYDDSLILKGFEKNAIPPVKQLFQKWFHYYFQQLDGFENIQSIKVDASKLLLASLTYLETLYNNESFSTHDWSIRKKVKSKTASLSLQAFFEMLLNRGTQEDSTVEIMPIQSSTSNSIMTTEVDGEFDFKLFEDFDPTNDLYNFSYALANYNQYLVAFSTLPVFKTNKTLLNFVQREFYLKKTRLNLEDVVISVE